MAMNWGDPDLSPPCVGYGGDCDEPTVEGTHFCRACLEASCDPNDTADPDQAMQALRDRRAS